MTRTVVEKREWVVIAREEALILQVHVDARARRAKFGEFVYFWRDSYDCAAQVQREPHRQLYMRV